MTTYYFDRGEEPGGPGSKPSDRWNFLKKLTMASAEPNWRSSGSGINHAEWK